jgi:hypothetical protein
VNREQAELLQLCLDFARLIDDGEAERVTGLFAAEGVLCSRGETIAGRAALRERFVRRQRETQQLTRHLVTNASFELQAPDRATGRMLLTVWRRTMGEPAVTMPTIADVHDCYVRESGAWRIAQRRIEVAIAP